MSFDDGKVTRYIAKAVAEQGNNPQMEWSYLYQLRQTTDPDDDDDELAAAEHYMYARWQVGSGETSEAVMILLTAGYDPAKLAAYAPAIWLVRRLVGHTMSTPSYHSMEWGFRGCSDGANDRKQKKP